MHGILLIAASHLRFLQQPDRKSHSKQELEHFSRMIPSFSKKLSEPMTRENAYVLGACSMLILQYTWANMEVADEDGCYRFSSEFGNLIGLYSGMKQLGLMMWSVGDPYLDSIMTYRPSQRICHYLEDTSLPLELETFFMHCCRCSTWSEATEETFNHRMNAARGLIPLLAAFKLERSALELSGLMPDILRCLFTWPLITPVGFRTLLERDDEASLVIVLYYFAAILGLASDKYWWMLERAEYLCRSILRRLGDRCEQCTGWASEICFHGNHSSSSSGASPSDLTIQFQ